MFYIFYHVTCDGKTTYIGKTVNFRHRKNNHIAACRYGTSTDKLTIMLLNVVKRMNVLPREPYLKFYVFMTVNNENKLLCYESYLHKMGFDTMNC